MLKTWIASLDPSKGNALLLTTNTEVSIAPKLHRKKDDGPAKSLPKANGSISTKPSINEGLKTSTTPVDTVSEVLRVLPIRLVQDIMLPEPSGSELLALVSPKILAQLNPTCEMNKFYHGGFTKLNAPPDPTSAPSSSSTLPEPAARVLNPGAHEESGVEKETASGVGDIFIGASERIPSGHIAYSVLPEGLKEWDLIR